jgi:hypothetical protein
MRLSEDLFVETGASPRAGTGCGPAMSASAPAATAANARALVPRPPLPSLGRAPLPPRPSPPRPLPPRRLRRRRRPKRKQLRRRRPRRRKGLPPRRRQRTRLQRLRQHQRRGMRPRCMRAVCVLHAQRRHSIRNGARRRSSTECYFRFGSRSRRRVPLRSIAHNIAHSATRRAAQGDRNPLRNRSPRAAAVLPRTA